MKRSAKPEQMRARRKRNENQSGKKGSANGGKNSVSAD
jgi:hypothetical protein